MKKANLCFDIALIPNQPLKELIIKSNSEITQCFGNGRILKNKNFPPHVSLLIAGADYSKAKDLVKLTEVFWKEKYAHMLKPFIASKFLVIDKYIAIKCFESASIKYMRKYIVENFAKIHSKDPYFRRRDIDRIAMLNKEELDFLQKKNTYKKFVPHLSIADLINGDVNDALKIVENNIKLPIEFRFEELQLVDVGEDNEKWEVIKKFIL